MGQGRALKDCSVEWKCSWEKMSKVIPPTFQLIPVWQGGRGEEMWVILG